MRKREPGISGLPQTKPFTLRYSSSIEISMEFPVIETERLTLRKPRDEDVAPFLKICQDEEVMLYYGKEPYRTEKQSQDELDWFLKIWREGTGLRWVISLKGENAPIGDIGYYDYEKKHRKAEIGYKIAREHGGKGYITEALVAVLNFIYSETEINRVQALVDPRNPASYKVIEKQGFQREGLLKDYEYERGSYVDLYMYSILRKGWESRQDSP